MKLELHAKVKQYIHIATHTILTYAYTQHIESYTLHIAKQSPIPMYTPAITEQSTHMAFCMIGHSGHCTCMYDLYTPL